MPSINGYQVYDSNMAGIVIPPTLINGYSMLTIATVWRAVNFLASNLASFPRHVHGADGGKITHNLDRILKRRPSQYQTATVFWRTLWGHAVQTGNGYAEIKRDGPKIVGLYNLLPGDVTPFRYDEAQFYYHKPATGEARILPAADVLHLPGLGYDGMIGYEPFEVLRDTFQRAATLDRYQTRYLQKGTVLRGSIEIPSGVSDEKLQQVVSTLRTYFSGADSERDVIVLSDGAKLNNATLSPQESQLVEQTSYSAKQIGQAFGVHPYYLYDDRDGKYNTNSEQAGIEVVRFTFRPWIELAEDELTTKLLTEAEQDKGTTVKINPDALLRGDTKTQADTVIATVNAGLRTRNEGRAILDMPPHPDPDSDKLATLGAAAPAAAPQPPAQKSAATDETRASFADPSHEVLAPIIAAAVERVEAKTAKAFANHADKPDAVIWANVFAHQQEKHVAEVLAPVAEAIGMLDGPALDVAKIADRYAAQIRRKASTGEATSLAQIVNNILRGDDHDQPAAA